MFAKIIVHKKMKARFFILSTNKEEAWTYPTSFHEVMPSENLILKREPPKTFQFLW